MNWILSKSTVRNTVISLLTISAVMAVAGRVSGDLLVELNNPDPGEIQTIGFELTGSGHISIEAVGIREKHDDDLISYAWIIDHVSREVVWEMLEHNSDRHGVRRGLLRADETIEISPGKYELYYFGGLGWGQVRINGRKGFDLDDIWKLFDGDDKYYDRGKWQRGLKECYVKISSDDYSSGSVKTFEVTGELPDALFVRNQLGDSEYVKWSFTLDRSMGLRLFGLFELPKGYRQPVDYGWLVNADTQERVWELDRWNSNRAGGGRKNRQFDEEVRLEKGTYILYFVTDDSHSAEGFNASPPYDPLNWGIQVLPGRDFAQAAFHEVEIPKRGTPLVDFTRARDNDNFEQAFRMKKPGTLSIYALGEYSTGSHQFVDYGWIEEAGGGRIVWEMTERNTEYAGGGQKNRMFDGSTNLPAGEYVIYYQTDGSHAYREWNVAAPFDPRAWGIAVYAGQGFDASNFEKLSASDLTRNSSVLASLTKIGDDERRRTKFTLKKDSWVRIYAIGEGSGREMYDYGWIIDDETGEDVWEMEYRDTRHAGGANKNRLVKDEIKLRTGTYVVYYISDGSHSYRDWNSTRPRDYRHWGITVSLFDKASDSY